MRDNFNLNKEAAIGIHYLDFSIDRFFSLSLRLSNLFDFLTYDSNMNYFHVKYIEKHEKRKGRRQKKSTSKRTLLCVGH